MFASLFGFNLKMIFFQKNGDIKRFHNPEVKSYLSKFLIHHNGFIYFIYKPKEIKKCTQCSKYMDKNYYTDLCSIECKKL